jgi:hypothetical protein
MKIVDYTPNSDQAFQGDVMIAPLPAGICISDSAQEIDLEAIGKRPGDVIIAAGEATGHNHAFRYGLDNVARFRDDGLARDLAVGAMVQQGTAKLYRDQNALDQLVRNGFVREPGLCIGFLRVENNAPPLTHDEHDAIRFSAREYYVCGKREMNAGEIMRVRD